MKLSRGVQKSVINQSTGFYIFGDQQAQCLKEDEEQIHLSAEDNSSSGETRTSCAQSHCFAPATSMAIMFSLPRHSCLEFSSVLWCFLNVDTAFSIIGLGWVCMSLIMLGLWELQRRWNDATVVDVAWSGGMGGMALGLAYFSKGALENRVILALVAEVWSLRLFVYLLANRVLKRTAEDGRYRALREKWQDKAAFNFLLFFQFQALLVVLFSIPFVPVAQNSYSNWSAWRWVGLAIAVVAIAGETIADAQLARWRSDSSNKGKTCRLGLWNYSRHPNYFFEWIHWWSYVFLAQGSPVWWIALWGPVIMWIFLFRVTGIPYTEAQALRSRSDYAGYQKTVSVFVPWFPRHPPETTP